MTKIGVVSDLHNEFSHFWPEIPEADIIVFCGDILTKPTQAEEYFKEVHNKNPNSTLIYLFGNHEFHNNDLPQTRKAYRSALSGLPYVNVLDNNTYVDEIRKIRIIGATLWTNFNNENYMIMNLAASWMNDYRKIYYNDMRFTVDQALMEFKISLSFIETELAKPFDGVTIIATHHSMTLQDVQRELNQGRYAGLEYAYHNDLDELLIKYKPKYALHGHTHQTKITPILDREGNLATTVIVNARGYVPGEPNINFKTDFVLEI